MPKKFYTQDELATFRVKVSLYVFGRRSKGLPALPTNPKDRHEISFKTVSDETGIAYNSLRAICPHLETLFRQYPNANPLTARQQELIDRLRAGYENRPIPCSKTGSPAYRMLAQQLGCAIVTVMRSEVSAEIFRLAAAGGTVPADGGCFDRDLTALTRYVDGLRQSGTPVPWNRKTNAPRFAKIGRHIEVSARRLSVGRRRAACLELVADLPKEGEQERKSNAERLGRLVDLALSSDRPFPSLQDAGSLRATAKEGFAKKIGESA